MNKLKKMVIPDLGANQRPSARRSARRLLRTCGLFQQGSLIHFLSLPSSLFNVKRIVLPLASLSSTSFLRILANLKPLIDQVL